MGIIDVPTTYGFMMKLPFYAMVFYTVNTFMFAVGLMDTMLVPMMGTKEEMVSVVTSPLLDGCFFGFTLCNATIAALIYPMGSTAVVKFQQLVTACFMFGFYIIMYFFYNAGMMGVPGVAQCAPPRHSALRCQHLICSRLPPPHRRRDERHPRRRRHQELPVPSGR